MRTGYLADRLPRALRFFAFSAFLDLFLVMSLLVLNARIPSSTLLNLIYLGMTTLVILSVISLETAFMIVLIMRRDLVRPLIFLTAITGFVFVAHLYIINEPSFFGIMDEAYYVPAARTLLSGTQCALNTANCNFEHPFLSKSFIAAGMALFGYNSFGWRIFQVILGTLSIPLIFILTRQVTHNVKTAYFAAVLLSLDTMFFTHSGAALIDIQQVFFALVAFIAYFSGATFWKLDKHLLAGVALGLALLSKETAIFLLAALLTYILLFSNVRGMKGRILSSLKVLTSALLIFIFGLQIYDSLFAATAFPTFVSHIQFILAYGSELRGPGWIDSILHTPITPFNWLIFYWYTYTTKGVVYLGVTNMIETWMTFLWVPLVVYEIFQLSKHRHALDARKRVTAIFENDGELKLAAFALIWFFWTYFPYLALFAYGRTTYPFYIVPAIPAIAIGTAHFISRNWVPYRLSLLYLGAVFTWFIVYYPVFFPEIISRLG